MYVRPLPMHFVCTYNAQPGLPGLTNTTRSPAAGVHGALRAHNAYNGRGARVTV